MSFCRSSLVAAVLVASNSILANPLNAQDIRDPQDDIRESDEESRLQAGPVSLTPSIRLGNFGYDSNVFNRHETQNPTSDFTGTVTPRVRASIRLPMLRVSGAGELDYIYYKDLSHLRAVDTDNSVRADVMLNRLQPYVAAAYQNIQHRTHVEIDDPIRFRNSAVTAGVDMRLTGKSSVEVSVRRSSVDYDNSAVFQDSNVSQFLDRTSTGEGVAFWYAATPLTMIGVDLQRQRDRFEFSPDRDSNRVRVSPVIYFQPHALITGRVQLGLHKREYLGRDVPQSQGTFLIVDLRYTLLGSTQFAVQAQRDLAYSYRVSRQEYQLEGVAVSVTQRLAEPWDLRATIGRQHLTYVLGTDVDPGFETGPDQETAYLYRGEVGYRIGATRLGLQVTYRTRDSNVSLRREFERVRVSSSIAYTFK